MAAKPDTVRLAHISAIVARQSGLDPSASPRTADALALIDAEKVSSVTSIVASFMTRRDAIEADDKLSNIGKQEQIRSAAASHLGNIATRAQRLVDLEAAFSNDRATAVPIPKADAADVALDLALVAHVRSAEPIPSRLVEMSERVRLALARTPVELSGITPEVQARVHGSLMSPAKAVQLHSEAEAINAARSVVQSSINELAPHAGWEPRELVQHFGAGKWSLPGTTDTLAEKLAADIAHRPSNDLLVTRERGLTA